MNQRTNELKDLAMRSKWIISQNIKNLEYLANGDSSAVFSFDDPIDKKTKVLHVSKRASDQHEKTWMEETNNTLLIRKILNKCPQFLKLEDFFFDTEMLFKVTEKAEMDLKQLVGKTKLDNRLLEKLIETLLNGLIFAHEHKVVHRGLDPQAILFTSSESFLISGLKISRQMKEYGTQIQPFESMGNPDFLPPEILNSDDNISFKVDLFKVDVYSFGLIILFCCGCSLKKISYGINKSEEIKHFNGIEEIITTLVMNPVYVDLVRKMCAFKPEDRCDIFQVKQLLMAKNTDIKTVKLGKQEQIDVEYNHTKFLKPRKLGLKR